MTSLRRSLQTRLMVALVLLLGAAGLGLFLFLRGVLVAQFDAALADKARILAGLVKIESDGRIDTELEDAFMPEFEREGSPEYFELRTAQGAVHVGSRSLRGARLADTDARQELVFWDLRLPDGRLGRAAALRFAPVLEHSGRRPKTPLLSPPERRLTMIAARERAPADRALAGVSVALFGLGVLLVLAVPMAVIPVVRRSLRPLDDVADRASTIDARRLDARFATDGLPVELRPIALRLNDLLERLSASFERERRFSADVAHELRTPLAELRTIAEVSLGSDGLAPETTAALRDVQTAAEQMERIVSALLSLARCEAGRQPVQVASVDLLRAVADAWAPFAAAARAKRLSVSFPDRAAPVAICADRALLAAILANLLSNAVDYTPERGRIACAITQDNDAVELRIENTQIGLSSSDLAHLFDPFWRKDEARTGGAHAGLGLSLASAFARLLGAQIRAALPRADLVVLYARFAAARASS